MTLFRGPRVAGRLASTAIAAYFFFGKFVILGGGEGEGGIADAHRFFTAEQLVALVLYLDLMTACLLAYSMGFLFRLPYVIGKLKALVDDGRFILSQHPWMRRATFVGLGGIIAIGSFLLVLNRRYQRMMQQARPTDH
ncbi:MAG: hypothetical protein U0939_16945 [Pirellulales bacterium]